MSRVYSNIHFWGYAPDDYKIDVIEDGPGLTTFLRISTHAAESVHFTFDSIEDAEEFAFRVFIQVGYHPRFITGMDA